MANMTYREAVLAVARLQLPEPISSSTWKQRMASYGAVLLDKHLLERPCHCCARLKLPQKLNGFHLPHPDIETPPHWWPEARLTRESTDKLSDFESWSMSRRTWHKQMSMLFSTASYLSNFFCVTKRLEHARALANEQPHVFGNFPMRVQQWKDTITMWMHHNCPTSIGDTSSRWVWHSDSSHVAPNAELCNKCFNSLARPLPEMPMYSLANGMWAGPVPPCLEALTWIGRKVIAEARVCCSLRRTASTFTHLPKHVRQKYHTGNVVSFMQEPRDLVGHFALLPTDLAESVYVQFVGADKDACVVIGTSFCMAGFAWLRMAIGSCC